MDIVTLMRWPFVAICGQLATSMYWPFCVPIPLKGIGHIWPHGWPPLACCEEDTF